MPKKGSEPVKKEVKPDKDRFAVEDDRVENLVAKERTKAIYIRHLPELSHHWPAYQPCLIEIEGDKVVSHKAYCKPNTYIMARAIAEELLVGDKS